MWLSWVPICLVEDDQVRACSVAHAMVDQVSNTSARPEHRHAQVLKRSAPGRTEYIFMWIGLPGRTHSLLLRAQTYTLTRILTQGAW